MIGRSPNASNERSTVEIDCFCKNMFERVWTISLNVQKILVKLKCLPSQSTKISILLKILRHSCLQRLFCFSKITTEHINFNRLYKVFNFIWIISVNLSCIASSFKAWATNFQKKRGFGLDWTSGWGIVSNSGYRNANMVYCWLVDTPLFLRCELFRYFGTHYHNYKQKIKKNF